MKGLIRQLAAALLLLAVGTGLLPGAASASPRINVQSLIQLNGVAYALSGGNELYRVETEGAQLIPLPLENKTPEFEPPMGFILLADEAAGYAVSRSGWLYRLALGETSARQERLARLELQPPEEERQKREGEAPEPWVDSGAIARGILYLRILYYGGALGALAAYDLATGERQFFLRQDDLRAIAPYGESLLLLQAAAAEEEEWYLQLMDGLTQSIRELTSHAAHPEIDAPHSLSYNAALALITIQSEGTVFAVSEAGELTAAASLPVGASCHIVLPQGLVMSGGFEMRVTPLDMEMALTSLVVMSGGWQDAQRTFQNRYPQIYVKHVVAAERETCEAFSRAMLLRDSTVDIFELPISDTLDRALAKGYYVPLAAGEALRGQSGRYHAFVAQEVLRGDTLAVYPHKLNCQILGYSRSAAQRLGISPQKLPQTAQELIDFIQVWETRYGPEAEAEGISLFAYAPHWGDNPRDDLMNTLDDWYTALMDDQPQLPQAQHEAVAQLYQQLLSIDYDALCSRAERVGTMADRYRINREPAYLFTLNASVLPHERNFHSGISMTDFEPLPLALLPGMKPYVMMSGSALVLNPYGTNQAEAQCFINDAAQYADPVVLAGLVTGAEPVPSQVLYPTLTARTQSRIRELRKGLANAGEADQQELAQQIMLLEAQLTYVEVLREDVSQAHLDAYQALIETCQFRFRKAGFFSDPSVNTLWWQFNKGQVTPVAYARRLAELYALMAKE